MAMDRECWAGLTQSRKETPETVLKRLHVKKRLGPSPIAQISGVSPNTVRGRLRIMGIYQPRYTTVDLDYFLRIAKLGFTSEAEAIKAFGRWGWTFEQMAKKLKISPQLMRARVQHASSIRILHEGKPGRSMLPPSFLVECVRPLASGEDREEQD